MSAITAKRAGLALQLVTSCRRCLTKANVAEADKREDMRADQLLGHDFATAQALGLTHDWAAKVIAATGNYGEIFDQTTGKPYQLERGVNALWTEGGLMAPMPMK